MKNLAILKIIGGGGYSPESKPKGGAHWAEPCASSATFGDRRSEA